MRKLVMKGLATSLAGIVLIGCGGGGGSNSPALTPMPSVPATPTLLAATAGNQRASLSWSASSGTTSYAVYQGTSTSVPASPAQSGITGTSVTLTGLTNGTTYYFVVRAINVAGQSGNSNQASVTPTASLPTANAGGRSERQ